MMSQTLTESEVDDITAAIEKELAYRAEELLDAAKHAIDRFEAQDANTKRSLFTMCDEIAGEGHFVFDKRTIHKAAQKIREKPEQQLSLRVHGGKKTAINNDRGGEFIEFIKLSFEKRDQDAYIRTDGFREVRVTQKSELFFFFHF